MRVLMAVAVALLGGTIALAAPSPRPVVVGADLPARVAAASADGREPACAALVPGALLVCFVAEGAGWLTPEDLRGPRHLDRLVHRARREPPPGRWVAIEGTTRRYLILEGEAAAPALLDPQHLVSELGTSDVRMAVPNVDVVLVWAGGDAELDTMMAVGVVEMFERQKLPVSKTVFQLQAGRLGGPWVPWAEARSP